ncbi:hypothetical protein BDR07DRAFT_220155 [Suillus spraguei]|nr:hypothetical protein BDR07DRAFT_220155 [Suillus spraguei]
MSISIMPILAIEALNGGISSTNAKLLYPQHSSLAHTHLSNMTVVSNDPGWWPTISWNMSFSYWTVAAAAVVVYDWALTLGQEIELIWRQRWSLMTVLYLVIRYIGILYSVIYVLPSMTLVSLTDVVSNIINYTSNSMYVVAVAMLGAIMIDRLHAMYQRSRIMLISLAIIFLAINIAYGTITVIVTMYNVGEEQILSGVHICGYQNPGDFGLLNTIVWVLNTVWEVLALCLSVFIAVKHFRDLRQYDLSTGSTIGDCFRVLMKSHVLYFASFAGVSCTQFISYSSGFVNSDSIGDAILVGALEVLFGVQMFVLGPRLILSVREYHAKLVVNSDAETSMNSIVFQERVHVSTSSTV